MKIIIFNGSPRKENTQAMVEAFHEGAESAGHEFHHDNADGSCHIESILYRQTS